MSKSLLSQNSSAKLNETGIDNDTVLNNYLKKISKIKRLSPLEEKKLVRAAQNGDIEAKKAIVQANLKLVVTIAKKAIHISHLPLIDLIQEGNLGLIVSIEKFNWRLGYKFSTYASWWIKQAMFKALSEQSHCMKIPVYVQETLSKFSKLKTEMERKYNCQMKSEDVARQMHIAPEKIDVYLSAYSQSVSIESGIELNGGKELNVSDILADENASVWSNIEYENLQKDIETVVSSLKEREKDVVIKRYGLGNSEKCTLEEIGNFYGVTKECIRQTELRALEKIRASEFGQEVLSVYMA
jgi:RNA polymerase primary sigma factor